MENTHKNTPQAPNLDIEMPKTMQQEEKGNPKKRSPNQIRITGVFEQVLTPSKFEKFKLLKNKVPLDLIIQRKFDITEEKKFRYHYKSASNLF